MRIEQLNNLGMADYKRSNPSVDSLKEIKPFLAKISDSPIHDAFDEKFTVHAGAMHKNAAKDEIPKLFSSVMSSPSQNPAVIYVHFPFCQSKCLYCGFHGRLPLDDLCSDYIAALKNEISWLKNQPASKGAIQAVYFGGGTPTVFKPEKLSVIVGELYRNFNLANDCEITLEGRLHDFSPENTKGFLDAGFSRFSIGVQSFNTNLRRSLGRLSDRETVMKLLSRLVQYQRAAVIIDLIYGLPGQSPEDFIDDLKTAESLGLDGLDTYQLNIFKGTPLYKALNEGKLPPAAPINEQGSFYQSARRYLLGRHWRQLSMSHYARTHRERNLYNPWTKRRADCLGIGAGAGGSIAGWSYYKMPKLENYFEKSQENNFSPDALMLPPFNWALSSCIIEQMEQGFLNFQKLFTEFNISGDSLTSLMKNWEECGLITIDDGWMNLTESGLFWGVNLTQAVIEIASNNMKS